jgi:hypothetical protein
MSINASKTHNGGIEGILLVGLFITALAAFALPASANTPVSVTYYFQGFTTGSCPPGGSLVTSPVNFGTTVFVGGPCPYSFMTGQYTGPTFDVTGATYTIVGPCDPTPVNGSQVVEDFEMLVNGPFLSATNIDLPQCTSSSSVVITPPVSAGATLANGENLGVGIEFGELNQPPQSCIDCPVVFGGTLVITGFLPSSSTPVPEFPFGSIVLLAVGLPLILILRAKYSSKVTGSH